MNRALVIEDDESERRTLLQQLCGLGITASDEAVDIESARRLLAGSTRYDLIVADLMLADGDTVELLRTAGQRQAGAGLILLSSLSEGILRSVAVLCRERGLRVLGALRKPLRFETLRHLIGGPGSPTTEAGPVTRAPTLDDLRLALERRSIGAVVQPIVGLADDQVQDVEVFARWFDPVLGQVPAETLARLAEAHGLSGTLTRYMIDAALGMCAKWRAHGLSVAVAVNVGNGSLDDPQIPDAIDRMLRSFDLSPDRLTLELGEQVRIDHPNLPSVLLKLSRRGVRIAMDNFGIGQAAGFRLQRLPYSELKIDRSFVAGLPDDSISRAVVDFGVRMGAGLGVKTTVVGVERQAQAQAARSMGCDRVQGNAVSEPMRPEELPAWARARGKQAGPGPTPWSAR